MWFFQLTILTLCLFCFSSTHLIKQNTDFRRLNSSDSKLIFAHVIFRHGDRNIHTAYPKDPWRDEIHWHGGLGQLTNEGKRQQFKLGQYFRRRYNKLIGDKYSPDKVHVQSTGYDRTIMSALANLAGLYPPREDEIWSDDIPRWQPIPVYSVPLKQDYVLYGPGKSCPKFNAAFQKYLQDSPEVQEILTKYQHLFSYWSEMCGSHIKSIGEVSLLYNTLYIENLHNKSLAAWAKKAIEPNGVMENITKLAYKLCSDTPVLARLRSGFLIKEMLEHFTQKIKSTLDPDRSLWLYSAHDFTISYFLNSLGLFKLHFPPYASSVHFELYKSGENEHYVQLFYRASEEEVLTPLEIPNCGKKCRLDQFYATYKEIIPDQDNEAECRLS